MGSFHRQVLAIARPEPATTRPSDAVASAAVADRGVNAPLTLRPRA